MPFTLDSRMHPRGDQAQAIAKLTRSLEAGHRHQTLLGVTGSGKTFTAANIIRNLDRPTLVISHNKTLAAQLYSEFRSFFPDNAVEYFVSYFDYYQPEAYIPRTDTYIEKDSSINDEIERLRLSTTGSLLSRRDTIVIASVSCIYGLASPEDFLQMLLTVKTGQHISRDAVLTKLVDMLYERNDVAFDRGRFRVRGDVVEVHPASADEVAIRIEFFGDEIERISRFDPLTGHIHDHLTHLTLFPAKQFVTPHDRLRLAMNSIREEMHERVVWFEKHGKLIEAQRIKMRTDYDLEMMQEMGFCSGIENYSRHLSGRPAGSRPYTLMDFFPRDFLLVIDESHATIPQIGGMYEGDRSRKQTLVDYGFRLPSALDNRPLKFSEFMEMAGQILYISATPGPFETANSVVGNTGYIPCSRTQSSDGLPPGTPKANERTPLGSTAPGSATSSDIPPARSDTPDLADAAPSDRETRGYTLAPTAHPGQKPGAFPGKPAGPIRTSGSEQPVEAFDIHTPGAPLIVEQIIRPTGLLDPRITIRPINTQIDETIEYCRQNVERGERVLITTLTKRTAEDLADYLRDVGLKVRYLHSDIDTIERVEILRALRAAEFDILVGINLLREGLDLPEVSLVCILDADKEGYLRSQTSLIQTAGRAARHVNGHVILFADIVTSSMQALLDITEYRRTRQIAYNEAHGITPQSVQRAVQQSLHTILKGREIESAVVAEAGGDFSLSETLRELEEEMMRAASSLEYEKAALLRDQIAELKAGTGISKIEPRKKPAKYPKKTGRRR